MNETLLSLDAASGAGGIVRTAECLSAPPMFLRKEYLRPHRDPWVVAYSGGKDSTLLLQLTWEMLLSLPAGGRRRKVYVVGNDTLVESPLVIRHLKATLTAIGKAAAADGLPIETQITKPHIDQTFWVNVIGRGYIPPDTEFPLVYRPDENHTDRPAAQAVGAQTQARRAVGGDTQKRVAKPAPQHGQARLFRQPR